MMQHSLPTAAKTKLRSKRRKRAALPLVRLAIDPQAKLDMPKTLENIGTIARNSFEDKRAPMHHVRNMIGSVKDAFLSGLRIAPQDLIVPSQYRIIDTKEEIVMKPADLEAIRSRAAAEATAEAEARAARERETYAPAKLMEIAPAAPKTLLDKLGELKTTHNNFLKKFAAGLQQRSTPIIDESALRRQAFGGGPVLGSRMNTGDAVDPFDFLKTFQKVGAVVRASIKSGQQTIQHVSDAAHSARQAFHTARFAAPRVLLPYARAPVLQEDPNRLRLPDKFMFVSPRFMEIKQADLVGDSVRHEAPIGMGEIMNAFGVSNPHARTVQKQRITVEKAPLPAAGKTPLLTARFADTDAVQSVVNPNQYYVYAEDIDEADVHQPDVNINDAIGSLSALKDIIGARTITGFLEEMKKDFSTLHLTHKMDEISELKQQLGGLESEEDEELKRFLEDLFANRVAGFEESLPEQFHEHMDETMIPRGGPKHTVEDAKERVGAGLMLPANLLKPFMSQPSTADLNEFFRQNGDVEEIHDEVPDQKLNNFLRMHALVASVNPQAYQELFNQTIKQRSGHNEGETHRGEEGEEGRPMSEEEMRISMNIHKALMKPFMGKIKPKDEYYYDYGYGDGY